MKRLLFAVFVMLAATTTGKAELYTGQTLGAGTYDPPKGVIIHGSFGFFGESATLSTVTFVAEEIGYPNYHVFGGNLHIPDGPHQGYYTLVPGGPTTSLSPSGDYIYDNVFLSRDKILDEFGLLFSSNNGPVEVNLFVDANDRQHILFSSDCHTPAVPEPSTLAIAVVPIALVLAARLRRSRTVVIA